MPEAIKIAEVRFVAAPLENQRTGLLGWISVTVGGSLRLDGLTLRRTADGRHAVSFPARVDGSGRRHPYIRPLDDRARREIEWQILSQLGLGEGWA